MTKRKEVEETVPEPRSATYVVSGPHRVHETAPGDEINLDPDEPETLRLLERGQIAAPSRGQSAGVASTEDAPASAASETKE